MALTDQDTGVVDGLGQAALEDLGLETTLQEVLDLEGQHVIETHARLVEHTDADQTADKGVTLEETLGILVVELEQLTGRTTDLGQDETNAPDLALVAETVLARELYDTVIYRAWIRLHEARNTPSTRHRDEPTRTGDEGPCNCNITD